MDANLRLDWRAKQELNWQVSTSGMPMAQYEVLILGENAKDRTYIETQHGDDQEAVRSALRIANGRPFEV